VTAACLRLGSFPKGEMHTSGSKTKVYANF
jgi:hypothetical protein